MIQPRGDYPQQFSHLDWLADMVIHARRAATFHLFRLDIGGQGDDRHPALIARVASSPSMTGICTSIRMRS